MAVVQFPSFDTIYGTLEAEICNKALSRIGAEVIKDTDEDTKQSRICKTVYAPTRDELIRLYPFNFATRTRHIPLDSAYPLPTGLYQYAYKTEAYTSFTGTFTNGSNVVTVGAGLTVQDSDVGLEIVGPNIPANTTIVAVDAGTNTYTLDRPFLGDSGDVAVEKHIPLLKVLMIGGNNNNLYESVGKGEDARILTNLSSTIIDNVPHLEMQYSESIKDPSKFDSIFTDALVLRIAIKIAISFTQSAGLVNMLFQEFSSILQVAKIASAEEKELEAPDEYYGGYGPGSNVRK